MKSIWAKLVVTVVVTGIYTLLGVAAFQSLELEDRSFYGAREFNSYQEAQTLQSQVVAEALSVGAKITQADITIQSPPTFKYIVVLSPKESAFIGLVAPTEYSFAYGERESTPATVWISTIIVWICCLGFTGLIMYAVWIYQDKGEK